MSVTEHFGPLFARKNMAAGIDTYALYHHHLTINPIEKIAIAPAIIGHSSGMWTCLSPDAK